MDYHLVNLLRKTERIEKLYGCGLGYAVWAFALDAAYNVRVLERQHSPTIEKLLWDSLSKSIVWAGPVGPH
jgi:hypothetical protein